MIARFPIFSRKKAAKPAAPAAAPSANGDDEEEARYKPIDAKLVRRMLGLLAPYKWHYLLGALLGMLQVTLELQSPRFTQAIIDHCSAWLTRTPTSASEPPDVSFVARWAGQIVTAL